MIGLIGRYSAFVSGLTLVARCALLVVAVVCVAIPVGFVAARSGTPAFEAAGLAAVVCLATGLVALLLAHRGRGTPASVAWVLAGDGLAMAVPLGIAMTLQNTGHAFHDAGFFNYLIVFFLATLTARTLLVAPFVNVVARPVGRAPGAEARV
ncbi:MAG: hypothetical protein C0483_02010 [Pirellula sp.]|nr:hypothetical protein [Pirellula sp.]